MKEDDTMDQPKLWTKDFILYFFASLFNALTFYTLLTTMAVYAIEAFLASESTAGLASSIFVIGALLARLIAGQSLEKIGRKKMMYVSAAIFLLGTVAYFFVDTIALLFIVRFIHGLAFGFFNTAMMTAVMSAIPPARRGEGTGYFSLSTTASTAIGPFLGIFLMTNYSFEWVLIATTVCSVLSLILLFGIRIQEASLTKEERAAIQIGFKPSNLVQKEAFPIALVTMVMGVAYSSIVSFINLYATELDLVTAAGYFFLVYAIFLFVSRPIGGKLLDAKGDNFIMYPSIVLFAVALLLLSMTTAGWMLLAAAAIMAFGFGTYMSAAQAIVAKVSPPNKMGLSIATYFIGLDFGVGIGPFVLGYVIQKMSYSAMYGMLAVVVFCLVGAYYVVHGKTAKSTAH